MEKRVAVIIPTYNRSGHLQKAVESVCSQTYSNWELVVVDDGSTDNSADIIFDLQQEFGAKIRYIHQQNRGPSAARNRGIRSCAADYLAFLDSDDWFDKNKLAIQIRAMEENPDTLISHTDELWYRHGRIFNQKLRHRKISGYGFQQCLEMCVVSISTTVVRPQLFQRFGFFDERFLCCEDYDLWLRVSIEEPFLLIKQPLTFKDGGRPDQVSFIHRVGMDKLRIRAIEKIMPMVLSPEQQQQALDELKKKCAVYGNGCLKHGKEEEGRYFLELPGRYEQQFNALSHSK